MQIILIISRKCSIFSSKITTSFKVLMPNYKSYFFVVKTIFKKSKKNKLQYSHKISHIFTKVLLRKLYTDYICFGVRSNQFYLRTPTHPKQHCCVYPRVIPHPPSPPPPTVRRKGGGRGAGASLPY